MTTISTCWEQPDCKILWVIFLLSCLVFFPALGSTGLLNTSDAYYTEAAREMLNRGDLITPYLNFSPFYDKPILTYWLIIASYLSFGVNTFAARLPSALCGVATALVIYSLGRRFISRRASFLAALAVVSMPLIVIVGHVALTDMPLTLLTTITNLLLLSALIRGTTRCLIPAYISLGLALLCKGPLAFAVAGTCIGGFLLLTSRSFSEFRNRFLSLRPLLGVAILLAVSLPWFVAEHIASHGAFTNYFFVEQNFGRLSGQLHHHSHAHPFWFYIPFLLGGFLPWLPLLVCAPVVFRINRQNRFSQNPRIQLIVASSCWLLGTLALLMISASKLPTYLLPLAPPIAILTGIYLDTIIRLGRRRFILWGAPILAIGAIGSLLVFPKMFDGASDLRLIASICVLIFTMGCTAYGVFVLKSKIRTGIIMLYISSLLSCATFVPIGILQTYRLGPESFEYLVKRVSHLDADPSIAVPAQDSPKAAFYAEKKIFEIDEPLDVQKFLATTPSPHYLIVNLKKLDEYKPVISGSSRVICTKGKWNLLLIDEEERTK